MRLEPSEPRSIETLLSDAMYGFERDDVDGLEFAKRCVRAACDLASPKRYMVDPSGRRVQDRQYALHYFQAHNRDAAEWLCKILNERAQRAESGEDDA